jgi:hypothetical protein
LADFRAAFERAKLAFFCEIDCVFERSGRRWISSSLRTNQMR